MEQALRLRPGLGAGLEQQLAPGSVADACSCEFHRPVELAEGRRPGPQRLIDRIATNGRAEIQCRQCRRWCSEGRTG